MDCINLSQLISYHSKELSPAEHNKVEEHLEMCSDCQRKIEEYHNFLMLFKKSYQPQQTSLASQCYDDSGLLSFIEATHSKKSREAFYGHLMECRTCMDRSISLRRVFNELRKEGLLVSNHALLDKVTEFISSIRFNFGEKLKSLWSIPKSLKPAYGLVGLILVLFISVTAFLTLNTSDETKMITRDNQTAGIQTQIRIISPVDNSILNIKNHKFQWTAPTGIIQYKLFLLDDRGNMIWEASTKNNKIVLPDDIKLNNNNLYFWQVESFYEDGTSVLSPMVSFTNIY